MSVGNLLDQARRDAVKIISSGGFESSIEISNPIGTLKIQVTGLHSKHWAQYETDANIMNLKQAHVTLSEKELNLKGYVTRNLTGEVALKDHRIEVEDATGLVKKYIIIENLPSETFGLIVCILGDFK